MHLSAQQLAQFSSDGFLFLPNVFSESEVALLRDEAEKIYATQREEVWREKSGAPRTAFAAHTYNEAFGLLGRDKRLVQPVEDLFGEKVYMVRLGYWLRLLGGLADLIFCLDRLIDL